ncbi:MAG: peptidoglycan-binding protein [Clostridiales bacterium]|nr:peptidoglycan-binding protein [Clostridiales bacterium]
MDIKAFQAETENSATGGLQIEVYNKTAAVPVFGAKAVISGERGESFSLETDISGQTSVVWFETPPKSYSEEPTGLKPYSTASATITKDGLGSETAEGIQIFPDNTAVLRVFLNGEGNSKTIVIDSPPLYEPKDEKIFEEEVKPINSLTGFVVLDRVVIPEYIIVHDGSPNDDSAPNYYVPYKDYIKNVASSEIYSTWEPNAIRANILAIISFTLNRVFTEWYRSKGKNYTITSSTAADHYFVYGRNIYVEISQITDELFSTYIIREGSRQPLLAQYCDGKNVSCPGWMTQWGSQYLAQQGYSAIEILRYFYGDDIYLTTAEKVDGVPYSFPGEVLAEGSEGQAVETIQIQLNRISRTYSAIKTLTPDGIYGAATAESVRTFQEIFNLSQTGSVDYATWYQISQIYVAVEKLA